MSEQGGATPDGRRAAERELLASLRNVVIGGRWLILLGVLAAGAVRWQQLTVAPPFGIAFAVAVLYMLGSVAALSRLPAARIPVLPILAADLVSVGVLVALSGGILSPFAGLFFLVALAGAVYYDLPGGLLAAAAGCATLIVSSAPIPGAWEALTTNEVAGRIIPHLLLTGGFAGYLAGQLKRAHRRRIETEERLRRSQYEERLRRREGEIAREIQLAAFPEPPQHPRFLTAVRLEPAREVGGDFYSFFPAAERLGVLIGDVSGKGVPAALVSTTVGTLARWLRPLRGPEQLLPTLNHELQEQLPEGTFASVAFAVLDAPANRLTLYNGGHPPPIIVSGGEFQRVRQANLLLGIIPDVEFEPETFPFGPGDTLVLYSDGFTEARNEAGEELTVEGLEELVHRHVQLTPEALADRLVEETARFGRVVDDLTLVIVRARPG